MRKIFIPFIIASLMQSSIGHAFVLMPGQDKITPTYVVQAYSVKDVRYFRMDFRANVIINQGERDALFIEGLNTVIKQLSVNVVGGVLTIKIPTSEMMQTKLIQMSQPLTVHLTVVELQGIQMSTGTVQSSALHSSKMALAFSGDSVGQLMLFTGDFRAKMSQGSALTVVGYTNTQRVDAKDRARFLGQQFSSEKCTVDLADSSQVYSHARLDLQGAIKDSSVLYVVGYPQSVEVDVQDQAHIVPIEQQPITPPSTPPDLPNNANFRGQGWESASYNLNFRGEGLHPTPNY